MNRLPTLFVSHGAPTSALGRAQLADRHRHGGVLVQHTGSDGRCGAPAQKGRMHLRRGPANLERCSQATDRVTCGRGAANRADFVPWISGRSRSGTDRSVADRHPLRQAQREQLAGTVDLQLAVGAATCCIALAFETLRAVRPITTASSHS